MSVPKSNGPIIDPALCRCCRAIKKCRVLTAEYNWMGKKEVYADMVMDCYGILLSHVDDNEKDSGVCATCVVRLREALAFRSQVLQCEDLFLQAKLAPPEEETGVNYENKLKKLELESIELKTEPKDYNSDHNSVGDDRDDALPTYSDDEDNKPLKAESTKPAEPLPLKDEEVKSEDSEEFSSSDSDEPIKKKAKRRKKTTGKEKKKAGKKQKADSNQLSEEVALTETATEQFSEEVSLTETATKRLPEEVSLTETATKRLPEEVSLTETASKQLPVEVSLTETATKRLPKEVFFTETATEQLPEELSLTETFREQLPEDVAHTETTTKDVTLAEIPEQETLPILTEEIHIKDEIQIEYSDESSREVPVEELGLKKSKKRRMWVRDRSEGVSEYELLSKESDEIFFEYMNMSKSSFEELHNMVELHIEKTDTNFRKCISTRERLAIFLRHIRTGLSFVDIASKYKVGRTTVSMIVRDVSRALWSTLQPAYMPAPREHAWRLAETGYNDIWNIPNCVGSIGGRHIIAKQSKENSEYPKISLKPCHKRFVAIALLAVTDPYHKILALDIGNYARDGHNYTLENSKFFAKYMDKKDFLPWTPLPGESEPCPHVLISDGSFTIRHNLLRTFPKTASFTPEKRIFNQYLDRACTIDKTFEMLMKSWTILLSPMETHVDTAVAMIKAICCLHNYVLAKHGKSLPWEQENGPQRKIVKRQSKKLNALKQFQPTNHRASNVAVTVRERFLAYFNRLDPIEMELENDSELDPSESNAGSLEHDSDMTMGHFITQMTQETNPVDTDLIQTSNVSFEIKLESVDEPDSAELNDPLNNTVESSDKPNDSLDYKEESLNIDERNEINKKLESSHESNQSADVQETDGFESITGPIHVGSSKSFDDIVIIIDESN